MTDIDKAKELFKFNPDYLKTEEDFKRIANEMKDEYLREIKDRDQDWIEEIDELVIIAEKRLNEATSERLIGLLLGQIVSLKLLKSRMEANNG